MNEHVIGQNDNFIFVPGDLIWTKIGGYPFWPCMITYDPVNCIYKRETKTKTGKIITIYHVQYFGQNAQRGWTFPGSYSSFPFRGENDLEDKIILLKSHISDLGKNAPKSLTLNLDKLKVPNIHKEKWGIAVKEAKEALLCLNVKKRFQEYVFTFEKSKKSTPYSNVSGTSDPNNSSNCSFSQSESHISKKIRLSGESEECDICKEQKIDFSCDACIKSFHLECVGLTKYPIKFKCIDCSLATSDVSSQNEEHSSNTNTNIVVPLTKASSNKPKTNIVVPLTKASSNKPKTNIVVPLTKASSNKPKTNIAVPLTKASSDNPKTNIAVPLTKASSDNPKTNIAVPLTKASSDNPKTNIAVPLTKASSDNPKTNIVVPLTKASSNKPKTNIAVPLTKASSDNPKTSIVVPLTQASSDETISPQCFVCESSSGILIKCTHVKCSKYYHKDCMHKFECSNKEKNICSYHTCLTCYRENPRNSMAHKGPMFTCARCPTSFHSRESCAAAGSVELGRHTVNKKKLIICPYHFVGKHKESPLPTCNMNYCSTCSQGGELICCEACPNAFHKNCLHVNIPAEDFYCEDCENRKYLLHGMIVWSKVGKFRWWPAKIIHPSDLPDNIKNIKHHNGEFPIQHFGTYDYSWTHSGRVFPYTENHKGLKPQTSNSSKYKQEFKKSYEEAATAFVEYLSLRRNYSLLDDKPGAYKPIKVNRPLSNVKTTINKDAFEPCSCDPSESNPCSAESNCWNYTTKTECRFGLCPAKDLCQNQKFQKRQYAETKLVKTVGRGWGLVTVQHITMGQFVIEYVGQIISHEEFRKRSGEKLANGDSNYYFLYIDAHRMIDAGPMGNMSRFINHSCEPNCQMDKWSVNGDVRIGIFAIRDISSGEELTFDYQSDKREFEQKCSCGTTKCQGFIGRKTTPTRKALVAGNKSSIPKTILQTRNSNIASIPNVGSAAVKVPKPQSQSNIASIPNVGSAAVKVPKPGVNLVSESFLDPAPEPAVDLVQKPVMDPISNQDTDSANSLDFIENPTVDLVQNPDENFAPNRDENPTNYPAANFGLSPRQLQLSKQAKVAITRIDVVAILKTHKSRKSDKVCFVCKKPRHLITCDEIGCVRAFHRGCLRRRYTPRKEFICDVHICDICNRPSHVFCVNCPSSFCMNCWCSTRVPKNFYCQICKLIKRKYMKFGKLM